jgi:large subunit ribosomal protein L2
MYLKTYKPTTPSLRQKITISRDHLWKGKSMKNLTVGKINKAGKDNKGRTSVWHKGGGHKKKYRLIDFFGNNNESAIVHRIEYDPNRTAYIALIQYQSGKFSYILAPHNLSIGDVITNFNNDQELNINSSDLILGNRLSLKHIPVGVKIFNLEMTPNKGGKLLRAAGTFGFIVKKTDTHAVVKLQSGINKLISLNCKATIGISSNLNNHSKVLGKAGASRWRNKRPTVRGVAMNPIDHPHGGGEGKKSGHRQLVTPWGRLTKGVKTRAKHKILKKSALYS